MVEIVFFMIGVCFPSSCVGASRTALFQIRDADEDVDEDVDDGAEVGSWSSRSNVSEYGFAQRQPVATLNKLGPKACFDTRR